MEKLKFNEKEGVPSATLTTDEPATDLTGSQSVPDKDSTMPAADKAEKKPENDEDDDDIEANIGSSDDDDDDDTPNIESVIPELPPQQASFCTMYKPILPKFGVMLIVIIGMFVFLVLKGGSHGTSLAGIECGSALYWTLVALVIPYLGIIATFVVLYLRRHPKIPMLEGDVSFRPKQIAGMVGGGIGAGIVSAFLGVGGGVVIGPLLLDLGLIPQVSTATSSFMILFTSSSSSFQYVLMGRIPVSFMAWYFMTGFFSAIVGQLLVVWVVKKSGKQSFVNFMLAAVIIISTLAMIILLIIQLVDDIKQGAYLGFHPVCSFDSSSSLSSSSVSELSLFSMD